MVKKLNLYFSHHLPGNIFRILAGERWIVAEVRQGNTKKANFAAITLTTGTLQWERLTLPEPWWVGAAAIHADILLLQLFADPKKPETRGLIGVDLPSGKIIWQQPEYSFVRFTGQGILAMQPGETDPVYSLLDPGSGEAISRVEATQIPTIPYLTQPYLVHPVHYTQENIYFPSIVSFFKQKMGTEPQKAVDYAEFQQLICISYYIYDHKKLSNYLLVLDKEGDIRLHEPIALHASGIGLDTFLIVHQYLIVIKDKKELLAYEL